MALYSKFNKFPQPLPATIPIIEKKWEEGMENVEGYEVERKEYYLPNEACTPEQILKAGYVLAPDFPDEYDPAIHTLTWDGSNWGVEDL